MRRFYLFRKEDATGISGTGRVADGVEFDNGLVCLTWKSQFPSVTTFTSISTVEKLHTHLGQHDTKIMWVDEIHEDVEERGHVLAKKEAKEVIATADNLLDTTKKSKTKRSKNKG